MRNSYIARQTWVNRTVSPLMVSLVAASIWYALQSRPPVPVSTANTPAKSTTVTASATPAPVDTNDISQTTPISPIVQKERDHLKFMVNAPSIKKVQKVEFYVEQQFVGAAYSQPYAVTVKEADIPPGSHTVIAKIYTSSGTTQSKPAGFTASAGSTSPAPSEPSQTTPPVPTPANNTVPVPQNITVSASSDGTSATLSWKAVNEATGYQIWRDGSQVATSTGAGYTDTGLMPGHTYDYAVVALVGSAASSQSTPVAVTMPDPHVLGDSTTDPGIADPPSQSSVQSPPAPNIDPQTKTGP